jgi:hypothetical protein
MAIMMHSPATLTPTCKTETLGCSRGLFPGLWVVTWPVGRYRARDPWAIPGPGPCATQTTGCASERRCGPSLQAGQGDSDGPPRAGCRRHPVWNGMYLRAAASWQCVLWDAPVAATVSPGSAPPILRRTARTGSAVCAHGHRDRTGHHDNTPPPPSQVEARLSTVVPTANGPARPRATTSKRRWIIHRVTVPSPGGSVTSAYSSLSRADPDPVRRVYAECKRTEDEPP